MTPAGRFEAARPRLFMGLAIASLALAWFSRAEDPPPSVDTHEMALQFQVLALLEKPRLPDFKAGETLLPAAGRFAIVVVTAGGEEGDRAIATAREAAKGLADTDAWWVTRDEASAESARKIEGARGGVSEATCRLVPAPLRPAILVVDAKGSVAYAHFPAIEGPDLPLREELVALRVAAGARDAAIQAPAPTPRYRGAMTCAACHRAQAVDWLSTSHSVAFQDLRRLGKATDPACLPCHITGPMPESGQPKRHQGDVQCESCHVPTKTHAGEGRMKQADYLARCVTCHEAGSTIVADFTKVLPMVSHRNAGAAAAPSLDQREAALRKFRSNVYFQFCARTEYVGSAACKECHQGSHAQWSGTGHAGAFRTLSGAGKAADPNCQACHTTGMGHKGGFESAEKSPAMAEVGCEACHGPGKLHLEAKTPAERRASMFRFDDKCPSCVAHRICATCHDRENDPDFDLGRALDHIRHRDR